MKVLNTIKISFFISMLALTVSCVGGYAKDDLIKKVSFDKDCPANKVEVTQEANVKMGSGDFKVTACGKNYKYTQMGSVYYEAK